MITATIRTRKKGSDTKEIIVFTNSTKAKEFLKPIAIEMDIAKKNHQTPKQSIIGVSYDFDSEYKMLLEIRAIVNSENETPDDIRR